MGSLRACALALTTLTVTLTLALGGVAAAAAPQPQTARALATMITAKGLNCKDFAADTGAGASTTVSEGTCTVGHEAGVVLSVFASHQSLVKLLPTGRKNICAELKQAKSSQRVVFVIATNWIATFESVENARPLAKAFHAKTQVLHC
jgi:hypothetical protein